MSNVTTLVATPDPEHNPSGQVELRASNLSVMDKLWQLSEKVYRTPFARKFPQPEQVFAAFMRGYEVGLEPFQSLDSIDVIQGTPTLKPEVMRALIRQQGHDYDIAELTPQRCVIKAHRREWKPDRWSTHTFTIDDAESMDLTSKDNWRKQPKAMLLARCTSAMARADFPDVIRGLSYTPEEIQDLIVVEDKPEGDNGPKTFTANVTAPEIEQQPEQSAEQLAEQPQPAFTSFRDEIAQLDDDAKAELKLWWKATLPGRVLAGAVPVAWVDSVRAKIDELTGAGGEDEDEEGEGDDEIVEAEIVPDRPAARSVAPPPASSRQPSGPDPQQSLEVLKAVMREQELIGPTRLKVASDFLGRRIKRFEDIEPGEALTLAGYLEGEDFQRTKNAENVIHRTFPGAEEE